MESRKRKNKKAPLVLRTPIFAHFLCCLSSGTGNEQLLAWRVGEECKTPSSLSGGSHFREVMTLPHCCLGSCGLSSPTVPSGLIWLQKQHGVLTLDLQAPTCLMKGQVSWGRTGWCTSAKADLHLLGLSDSLNKLLNQQLIALRRVFACLGRAYVTAHAMMLASIHPSFLSIIHYHL